MRSISIRSTLAPYAVGLSLGAEALLLSACGPTPASDLTIERLPDVTANVPNVPTLPPPPYPVNWPDSSYSVYGVRRRESVTMDSDVVVTGYIVEVYTPPVCEEGRTCPTPAAPHMWIADARGVSDPHQRLLVVGYADNQLALDEARELASRGRYEPPDPETGLRPIPTDFDVGAKVRVSGRFARISGSGFNVSEGLLEWNTHETLEPVTPPEE
jgi:hypothetical protein